MRWLRMTDVALGAGAFGEVWKALDVDTGRIMAAKVVRMRDAPMRNALRREVDIFSRVSHVRSWPHQQCILFFAAIPSPPGAAPTADVLQKHIVDYIFSQGWEGFQAEIFIGLSTICLALTNKPGLDCTDQGRQFLMSLWWGAW
jgi:serine/threonine protein kinase